MQKKEGVIEEQWYAKHIDITEDEKIKVTKINKYIYIKYLLNIYIITIN